MTHAQAIATYRELLATHGMGWTNPAPEDRKLLAEILKIISHQEALDLIAAEVNKLPLNPNF